MAETLVVSSALICEIRSAERGSFAVIAWMEPPGSGPPDPPGTGPLMEVRIEMMLLMALLASVMMDPIAPRISPRRFWGARESMMVMLAT